MLLICGLALGLLLGRLSGGRFRHLASLRLAGEGYLALGLALSLASSQIAQLSTGLRPIVVPLWISGVALSTLVGFWNARVPGALAIASGSVSNAVVVALNGGMPVSMAAASLLDGSAEALRDVMVADDGLHQWLDQASRLPLLSDIAVIPGPALLRSAVSVGDALLVVGVAVVLIAGMHSVTGSAKLRDTPQDATV